MIAWLTAMVTLARIAPPIMWFGYVHRNCPGLTRLRSTYSFGYWCATHQRGIKYGDPEEIK